MVHGIPSEKQILREGQILSIDCGLVLDGWQADSAFTMGIGEISPEAQRLIDVTEQCFFAGARQAIAGKRLGDVGHAVQQVAESNGYGVIRDLTGHGIGREMHEDPPVFNYGTPDRGLRLRKGMTIAIEPMISAGDWHITCDADQWCYRTRDRSLTSHYEHTIAINEDGLPEILTYPDFKWEDNDESPDDGTGARRAVNAGTRCRAVFRGASGRGRSACADGGRSKPQDRPSEKKR